MSGCATTWQTIGTDPKSVHEAQLVGKLVKITQTSHYEHKFIVSEVNYPHLITNGSNPDEGRFEVSLKTAISLEYRDKEAMEKDRVGAPSAIVVTGVGILVLAILYVQDLINESKLRVKP